GSIKLMGTGGNITGLDVDILICDDLIKGFYDTTPTLLAKKVEWFKEIILQRLEPHSKLIILGTRWAENDVIGYLEKQHPDDYKFIVLKALNEDGTCIWSNRYTPQFFINRRNEIGDRLFESLYQQRPLDETGSFFNIDKMIWHDTVFASHYVSNVRSWDLAYSDESKGDINDSTAGVPMYKVNDNHYVITDFEYGQYGEGLKNKLLSTAKSDGPNTKILLETGTKGGASKFLYTEYESYLKGDRCEQSEPIGSKVDRAYAFKEAILDGKIHVHIINPDLREIFIKQLRAFPLGKHDDIIDACAYAYNYLKDKADISGIYGTGDSNY
ncbi:MAG: hypothetical protein J6T69_06790, partial [Methanobrevibacter sp.]|nr:hypothetical protein [Methanobrevibacter sp.]